MLRLPLIVLVTIVWFKVSGQSSPNMRSLSTLNGLSSNTVYDVVQDDDGFLWIATADGLDRYDGTEIRNFFYEGNKNSIPSNIVRCLRLLPDQMMAIGTSGGLSLYDFRKRTFKNFYYKNGKGLDQYDNYIQRICVDDSGYLWLGAATCVMQVTQQGVLKKIFRSDYTQQDIGKERFGFVHKMIPLPAGRLLLFLNKGNYIYDPAGSNIQQVDMDHFPELNFISDKDHTEVYDVGNGRLIFFNKGIDSVYLFSESENKILSAYFPYPHYPAWRQNVVATGKNSFVLSHHNYGMNTITLDSGIITVSELQYPGQQLGKAFADRQGNTWLINYLGGLLKMPAEHNNFEFIPLYDGATQKLIDVNTNNIYIDKHLFFICTYGKGIFIHNTKTKEQRQIKLSDAHDPVKPDYIWQIIRHRLDTFWMGTQQGIFWLTEDLKHGRLKNTSKPAVLDSVAISTMFADSRGRLWMGCGAGKGVCIYDKRTGKFKWFRGREKSGYPLRYPMGIAEDKNGKLWFVSDQSNELLYFDEARQVFVHVPVFRESSNTIAFNCIYIDEKEDFWIGSNAGLIRYNPITHQTNIYGRMQGLCNSFVEDITVDRQHNLWLNTDGGLACFNPDKKLFTNFYYKDGLPSEFLDFRFHNLPDGKIITGGFGGLIIFNPQQVLQTSYEIVPLLFTEIIINGHAIGYSEGKRMELKSSQNNLSFKFTGIDLSNGPQNNYMYKLAGSQDTQWISIGQQHQVNFTNLNPGNYKLYVRCTDEAGNIKSAGLFAAFIIHEPFTNTPWFYASIVAIAGMIFYFFYKIRLQQIRKLQRVRENISRDLHDEIGAHMTNISLQSVVGKMYPNDPVRIAEAFNHIDDDSQKVSAAMREIIWSINPENDKLENALPRMLHYATELLEARGITVSASLPAHTEIYKLAMERRRDLFLIFKEAITNVVKHSDAGRVKISFEIEQKKLLVKIEDDGKGYEPQNIFGGNGLMNMKQRAEKHNWHFVLQSEQGRGSSLYLAVPIA